jgi:hypothetical protein
MRRSRRTCPFRLSRSSEGPPALTGDLEADAEATLAWLWSHPELWLEDERDEATGRGGAA